MYWKHPLCATLCARNDQNTSGRSCLPQDLHCQLGEDADNLDTGNPSTVWEWAVGVHRGQFSTWGGAGAGKEGFLEEVNPSIKGRVMKAILVWGNNHESLNHEITKAQTSVAFSTPS